MKSKQKIVKLPVSYTESSFDDERFMKLRVKVMHTGLNLNNSNFDADAVNAAEASLANIPLLAFVKKTDGDSDSDFAGHEYEIKITEDDVKYTYLGRPIGIVPESNNYSFETDEETGKTFVMVDAYVWRDYANSALDILNRDLVKKVSMEIIVDDYEWEESYVNIKSYKYTGIALLGEDVREAMIGANAEIVQFSEDAISKMLSQLKEAMSNFSAANEPAIEPEVVEPTVDDNFEDETDTDEVDTAEYGEEDSSLEDDEESVDPDEDMSANNDDDNDSEKPEDDMTADPVEPIDPIEPNEFEIKIADLEAQIKEFEDKIEILNTENTTLKEFKEKVQASEFEAKKELLFDSFEDLTEEEIAPLKEVDYSLEELEVRLYALRGKKVQPNKPGKRMGIDSLFNSEKVSFEPIYADLVKKNIKK